MSYEMVPTWIALLFAVYIVGASTGELVKSGSWAAMVDSFEKSPSTAFLTGIVLIAIGGAIYLVTPPWSQNDWLGILVKVMGGGMVLEGFAALAFTSSLMTFSRAIIGRASRLWALVSLVAGLALAAVALNRIFA